MHQRRWTDSRDGTEWTITYNPGVELARPRERSQRSHLVFQSEDGRQLLTDAVYGSDLESLDDDDLRGLLDQARESEEDGGPEEDAPGSVGG